ncbi:pepsin-like aspartic protease [Aspergillus clavatus NRRL 1]|uniref:Aspartic-type endopeptidase (CtsD), putative n=1 Tax=Aspergillus clavatus (strain ATCC 1007 / CBS 513.65 / DSM 816 / NCTC 3887 / NRRL 1 / QM 1276 / 107) TaxID=344612 RepID=A1CH14_ASPCL|nr:aspartic-type endopeptidase (CtsD), putative [Aspergillus clavatus NRRL 1]EAW10169.1 aspartic-type endopeptidase (CtsD), putative [Aspergillus clavatus NRRL 1]
MRFSQCLLTITYLASTVTAFVPYSFHLEASTDDSAANDVARRFVPWTLLADDPGDEPESITLDIKKMPVRRDNKYRIVIADTPTTPNTAALSQDGMDYSYFCAVDVGSQRQRMWMLLDTGGPNTWVFSSECETETCTNHTRFEQPASKTLKPEPYAWAIGYGKGQVSGVLGNDTLSISGMDISVTLGLAKNASSHFDTYPADGILGLGWSNNSNFDRPSFMEIVKKQGLLKSNTLAFSFSRNSDGAKDGTVNFGTVDTAKFTGEITYTDIVPKSKRWNIPLDDASVNGVPCGFTNKSAFIDTGTSYAMLPPKDAIKLHNLIPGATTSTAGDNFTLPCNSTAVVQFNFSGLSYSISPKDYVGPRKGSSCLSTIVGQALDGDDMWLLGDVFLKNVYTVFDYDHDRIGFANRSVPIVSTTTTAVPSATGTGEASSSSADPVIVHKGSATSTLVLRSLYLPALSVILCIFLL